MGKYLVVAEYKRNDEKEEVDSGEVSMAAEKAAWKENISTSLHGLEEKSTLESEQLRSLQLSLKLTSNRSKWKPDTH